MELTHVWLRLELPAERFSLLEDSVAGCEFLQGKDSEIDPQWLKIVEVVFTDRPLPDALVARMPRLKWLHVTRGGVYSFITPAIRERPIEVSGSRGIHGRSFTEFGLACIFALAKHLPECWQGQKEKRYGKDIRTEAVAGKTLGIVGLGTVGSELARTAKLLGLHVLATKRTVESKPDYVDELGWPEYLPRLLGEADFVALTLAGVPSTEGMIGEKELRLMKTTAYLINLTGGRAIEEEVLVRALKEGWIAGAALDALPREPLPPDSELWTLPNVIIGARLAGATSPKWEGIMPIFVDNLRRFHKGEPLRNVADKEWGY